MLRPLCQHRRVAFSSRPTLVLAQPSDSRTARVALASIPRRTSGRYRLAVTMAHSRQQAGAALTTVSRRLHRLAAAMTRRKIVAHLLSSAVSRTALAVAQPLLEGMVAEPTHSPLVKPMTCHAI